MLADIQNPFTVVFPRNLQQNSCHVAHHTLDVSLHYLAKLKMLQRLQTLPKINIVRF